MELTRRSHYNPCFWSAFWNREYYNAALHGYHNLVPRQQVVYALSVKSNKLRTTNVDGVFFEKQEPLEVTFDAMKRFVNKYHPEKYEEFCTNNDTSAYPIFLTVEQFFTMFERLNVYKVLLDVIKRQYLSSGLEKASISVFIYLQKLR